MRITHSAVLLALLLFACGIVDSDDDLWEQERDRLERNAQLWATTEPTRYAFFLQRVCFCGTEVTARVRIEVMNGAVISRTYDSGQPVPAQWHELFPPIEGVFEIVRDALDRMAAEFDVQYDPVRGYPRTATIDYVLNAADEELTFRVTSFSVE